MARITKALLREVIHPIWEPIAKGTHLAGVHLFESVNYQRVGLPPKWERMVLTPEGELEEPKFRSFYCPAYRRLVIRFLNDVPYGIGIFDREREELEHYAAGSGIHTTKQDTINRVPTGGKKAIFQLKRRVKSHPRLLETPIVYVYALEGEKYSETVVREVKKCNGWRKGCNLHGGHPMCERLR